MIRWFLLLVGPYPNLINPELRGEGVAIVLLPPIVSLWKSDGEQWKAWSPRIVSAHIKWMCGKRRTHLHIISCYAPTFVVSREEKNVFFDDLQQVLDEIPSDEPFVLLGDFNARVGTRQSTDDQSRSVRGPHGLSELNDAGKELLSFLSMNEVTICNMWFKKPDIRKYTWQHPKSGIVLTT